MLDLLDELGQAQKREAAANDFLSYVKAMWPVFIEGRHHKIMAEAFDRVISGKLKRLIINMAPRHTKSEFASIYLPSKYLGHYPHRKIIQTSHNADLAVGFGRKVRNLVDSKKFQDIFPGISLMADAKAAGRWDTSASGEYFAIGVGGKLAGRGADLLIIDDPHSEQDYIAATRGDTATFDKAYEWYTSGPRQRLQPGGAIVIVMTRWHKRDLTGRIIDRMTSHQGVDDWEIIEFPALMPDTDNPLWPEFWPYEELCATRDELPVAQWNAQYLQNPIAEEGAIVKREWWNIWKQDRPPRCEFVIQGWDTAFLKSQRTDFNACTEWGVFYHPDETGVERANIILLDAFNERLEFPELKRVALKRWQDRQPDAFLIEAKATGLPLIFELRQMGIPVSEFQVSRGSKANPNDKISRVNSVADLFRSGMVWRPDTRWAEEVAEQFAAFPAGDHDDLVDSGTMCLIRFRQGGFITLHSDEPEEVTYRDRAEYY